MALWLPSASAGEDALAAEVDSDSIEVRLGDRSILRYRHAVEIRKPYLQAMWTPKGLQVLLDAPEDHKHHHGLMFAVRVDSTDFWVENSSDFDPVGGGLINNVGWQVPWSRNSDCVTQSRTKRDLEINQDIQWLAEGSRQLLVETRKITSYAADDMRPCTVVSWQSRLTPAPGLESVKLWGPHYCGLGMRLASDIDGSSVVVPSTDTMAESVRGGEQLYAGAWCACIVPIEDRHATVVMMDHPENERPAKWFAMTEPFSYLAATIGLDKEPLHLRQGNSVDLKYGIAVADGELTAPQIEILRELWLQQIH